MTNAAVLTLTTKSGAQSRIDWSQVADALHAAETLEEIERLRVRTQDGWTCLGERFQVRGTPSHHLVLEGDCSLIDGLGYAMQQGTIIIESSCGHGVGENMRGGSIHVKGNAMDDVGACMRGGSIRIDGRVGANAGGRSIGATHGMSGGLLWVAGDCGDRTAERLRRGTIVIGGAAGNFGGWSMTAGTVIVFGKIGDGWCERMMRGTVISSKLPRPSPRFSPPQRCNLTYLKLLWRFLTELHIATMVDFDCSQIHRCVGDRTRNGLGEWLQLSNTQP